MNKNLAAGDAVHNCAAAADEQYVLVELLNLSEGGLKYFILETVTAAANSTVRDCRLA